MGETVNSIHFLWTAYILVVVANMSYVGWLVASRSRLNKGKR